MNRSVIAIYGAQMVAVSVYHAIKTLYKNITVHCFIVTDRFENPASIEGIPVVTLDGFRETGMKIVIATPENHHAQIIASLRKKGINDYLCVDSEAEAALMEHYYKETGEFSIMRSYPAGQQTAEVCVYMSRFHKDAHLSHDYHIPDWVHPIQAGASLTELRIADILDNEGENISEKNVNYCELTALYWAGKHGMADYLGLFHYRRILDFGEEDLCRLPGNGIDVVLPYPTVHYPNIGEHHRRYLKESDWKAMQEALRERAPEYAAALPGIFAGQYFYNYNMLIAKKEIFKDYCRWLFPILERIEGLSVPKGNERADRYVGYLGENLTTLYFMYHRKDYKIAHVGRRMLV